MSAKVFGGQVTRMNGELKRGNTVAALTKDGQGQFVIEALGEGNVGKQAMLSMVDS
jgi:hypothetical protein